MKTISFKGLILGLIFVILPTIAVTYPLLLALAEHYTLLFIDERLLVGVFAVGIISGYILHGTKIRFLLIFALLLYVLNYAYHSIGNFSFDEFDAYYVANRFKINISIFLIGWFSGFAISRWRYFLVVFSILILGISVIVISALEMSDVTKIIWLIAPTVFYMVYILFVKELIMSLEQQEKTNYLMVAFRILAFSIIALFLFWGSTKLLDSTVSEIQSEITAAQDGDSKNKNNGKGPKSNDKDDKNDKNNKDDNKGGKNKFDLDDYTGLRDKLKQSEELLFCAYIDNFIEEGIPNPQYITLYHLNQYNPTLEQFEVDPDSIIRDLFIPDPTSIPQYFVQQNDSVLVYDRMERGIKEVKSTIYIADLNPEVFVAPSTAFACQPISVEEQFQEDYKFAYNVYSEVSELNSAYFVYNTKNPSILNYQKSRYQTLRRAKSYDQEDPKFMDYYTEIPEGDLYERIGSLADSLTKGDQTAIDKILSIRNYFLSKDENGKQLYTYTLTPGKPTDPNIPNASMLGEFLFNTHKGYCTYFATSSQFMLRSLGIPTRTAVGFMTIDRSHKNPGWYWFYADQAHAWSQVYIPEYGWLDFDMTVSNEGAEQAPQPDQTPPTPPTKETFVGKGLITKVDTTQKRMEISVDQMIINDSGITLDSTSVITLDFDVLKAKVFAGDENVPLHMANIGDTAVMVSFDYKIGEIRNIRENELLVDYMKRFPDPIPIMEVHLPAIEEEEIISEKEEENVNVTEIVSDGFKYLLIVLILLVLILLLTPILYYRWLAIKSKNNSSTIRQAEYNYKNVHFLLNQMGLPRDKQTPLVYAKDIVDPKFGTDLVLFITIYQKLKYSQEKLTEEEKKFVQVFYKDFNQKVLSQYSTSQKIFNFIKPHRWIHYWTNLNLNN